MYSGLIRVTMLFLSVAIWIVGSLGATAIVQAAEPVNGDLERFLPSHGNSVYNATGLLRRWPSEGPKELWRIKVGWGKERRGGSCRPGLHRRRDGRQAVGRLSRTGHGQKRSGSIS